MQDHDPPDHRNDSEKLAQWKPMASAIREICEEADIDRSALQILMEGYKYLRSETHFVKFFNGVRSPPNVDEFVSACAKAINQHVNGVIATPQDENKYLLMITGQSRRPPLTEDIFVETTRKKFWEKYIRSIVMNCDTLVVLDSFHSHKQIFWQALTDRVTKPEKFRMTYLILKKGDPFLKLSLDRLGYPDTVTGDDIGHITLLKEAVQSSANRGNKNLEFLYWQGMSPGPLLAWTKKGTEIIELAPLFCTGR
jgi:hypothetical protein